MWPYSIILGAFIELIMLKAAKMDIPGCHFLETVNISSSQRLQNGSYIYLDLEIPVNLTGQYDYITTEGKLNQFVRSHLRGCVCHLKPCIWICCRFKDWDASNNECIDDLMEQLSDINPLLKVTLSNGSVVNRNLLKDFIVLRDRMRWDDLWEEDNYKLLENGSLLLSNSNTINIRGYDCFHPNQFTLSKSESFVVAFHNNLYYERPQMLLPGERELMWLSEVFLVLTIAVYAYVRKLRNLHGKCFICYMISTFFHFIHLALNCIQIPLQLCNIRACSKCFFIIAKLNWLVAMSHQLWRSFTSVNQSEPPKHSFGAYSILAWGTAAIWTGVIFLFDEIWEGDPKKVDWVPGIGWQGCYLKVGLFYDGYKMFPTILLVALNTILFILTTISIIKVKLALSHFSDQHERARNLNSRMQTYKVFLRLMFLMDIQWSVRLYSIYVDWNLLLKICLYCDSCIGLIIFVLFVLKRNTLVLLMKSIRK